MIYKNYLAISFVFLSFLSSSAYSTYYKSYGEDLTSTRENFSRIELLDQRGKKHRFLVVEELDPDSGKDKNVFDYSGASIADIKSSYVKHIDDVLAKMEITLRSYKSNKPTFIYLKGNYLTDSGIEKICNFISDNTYLKKNLTYLDLSNNRFTGKSLKDLENLLKATPNLQVDISINCIEFSDLKRLTPEFRSKVTFSPY